MGWLRDLMVQAEPAVRSFGEVARAAREHADWPADSSIHPRSLASILSKLDRGQDMDWLIDRPPVQKVLAEVLSTSLNQIKSAIEAGSPRDGTAARRVRLTSLRAARFLDLVEEPLFPGIPPEVMASANFRRTWWYAPSGSGRSFVGRWLESRGLARFVRAPCWADARAALPERGAVFVELEGFDDAGRELEAVPERVCIAAPFLPNDDGLRIVRSPPVESYLEALVHWAAERLPRDGRFDPATTLDWLRREPLQSGVLDGVGAALELCGLADELGAAEVGSTPLTKLARRFLRQRSSEALDPALESTRFLKRAGFETLLALLRRVLTDRDTPWDAPRSVDDWLELVPSELGRETDVEWLRLSLSQVGSTIRPSDIEKAARRLPPGAFRLVQALQSCGLLESAAGDRLKPGPRWFMRTLLGEAVSLLVRGSPFEWGEAVLRPHAAPLIARALLSELATPSHSAIEALLELEFDESPAYVAALETSFRCAGLATLAGAELPADLIEELWEEQLELIVTLSGELPGPRIDFDERAVDRSQPVHSWLPFERGAFLLAALALSEELPSTSSKHPLLRPWAETEAHPELGLLYDQVLAVCRLADPSEPWARAAFSLVDRLRHTVGFAAGEGSPHPLELPGAIFDELSHGVLSFELLRRASEPLVLDALAELCNRRGTHWPALAEAAWKAWSDAGRPAEAGILAPDAPGAAGFWPHLPPDLLRQELASERWLEQLPYSLFSSVHWGVFAKALRANERLMLDPRPWRWAPKNTVVSALDPALPLELGSAPLAEIGRRFPDPLLALIEARLASERAEQSEELVQLLEALPLEQAAKVSELLGDRPTLYALSERALIAVRRWLYRAVRARAPGYRPAFLELSSIERKVR